MAVKQTRYDQLLKEFWDEMAATYNVTFAFRKIETIYWRELANIRFRVHYAVIQYDVKGEDLVEEKIYEFTIPRNLLDNPVVVVLWAMIGLYMGNPPIVNRVVYRELNDRLLNAAMRAYLNVKEMDNGPKIN